MQSMAMWPLLALAAGGLALVPTIEDTGHRALAYWLVIPPLVAGVLAACAHFGVL